MTSFLPLLHAEEPIPALRRLGIGESLLVDRVVLEVSLKPFRSIDDGGIDEVARILFAQWEPLVRRAQSIAILLWTADGSEILDYAGKEDDEIEWARYIGVANPRHDHPQDPDRLSTATNPQLYCEEPCIITYGDLRRIVGRIKKVISEESGLPVVIGAAFDPGPEFARSTFKYVRHPEVSSGRNMGQGTWVNCAAMLHADTRPYAGFPAGIPEHTSLGTFLGRQCQHFLGDMGFDYIWFSNGFGFSSNAWQVTGELFDGLKFFPERAHSVREAILGFWREFRAECSTYPIETRGSNFSTAMDLASEGSPLKEIYEGGFEMMAPTNSPWAAMDADFGLEIVGYLSHIATLPPGDRIGFRYYLHDPWFLNSPWCDRYGREAHDIYLPLALARLNGHGDVTPITSCALLSVDTSRGELLPQVPIEVMPHFHAALSDRPDAAAPVVWVYPFQEYCEISAGECPQLEEVFFGDWFVRGAVNQGFPLGAVISSENLSTVAADHPEKLAKRVLLSPVPPAGSDLEATLLNHAERGGDVLFYGSLTSASPALRDALGVELTEVCNGDFEVVSSLPPDVVEHGEQPSLLRHNPVLSSGGIDTIIAPGTANRTKVLVSVKQGAFARVYAVTSSCQGAGRIAWLRGTLSADVTDAKLPVGHDPQRWIQGESFLRAMLSVFGVIACVEKPLVETRAPVWLAAACRNGHVISGYSHSSLTKLRLRFPWGAPLMTGCDAWLEGGEAKYSLSRSWHRECRCYVDQSEQGAVECVEQWPGEVGLKRRIMIRGLRNATVRFRPEPDTDRSRLRLTPNDVWPFVGASVPFEWEDGETQVCVRSITGSLLISW